MTIKQLCFFLGCALAVSSRAIAAPIFEDDFDSYGSPVTVTTSGTSGNYTVNMSPSPQQHRIIFGYDYGVAGLGIPQAPRSTGIATLGARLDANLSSGTALVSSFAFSPLATVSGDMEMTFDMYLSSVAGNPGTAGAWNNGGTGSSENMTAGVGYNGTSFQNATSGSGVWFSATGDGGFSGTSTTPDYQARIGTTLQAPNTAGVYAAGTATGATGSVDNANAYYTSRFPGQPTPTGYAPAATSPTGSLLFKWHTVKIKRVGTTVTWSIDDNLIATVTNAAATATDRVSLGYWDPANTADTGLVFGVIDNLLIVPEPSSSIICLIALLGFLTRRRR